MSYQEEMKRMIDEAKAKAYNKAVDDFVERITLPLLTEEDIGRIVDELKGGAGDEF